MQILVSVRIFSKGIFLPKIQPEKDTRRKNISLVNGNIYYYFSALRHPLFIIQIIYGY